MSNAARQNACLDSRTGAQVLELMKQINRDGTTVILITHDNGIASQAKRIVRVMDGKILCDSASGGRPLEVVS